MRYTLCIEGDSGKINITDPDVIKKISIKISQSDKSANDRSDQLFGDLVMSWSLPLRNTISAVISYTPINVRNAA